MGFTGVITLLIGVVTPVMVGGHLVPSLKLTLFAPENWWLEDEMYKCPFGFWPIFRGELLVLGRVTAPKSRECGKFHPHHNHGKTLKIPSLLTKGHVKYLIVNTNWGPIWEPMLAKKTPW